MYSFFVTLLGFVMDSKIFVNCSPETDEILSRYFGNFFNNSSKETSGFNMFCNYYSGLFNFKGFDLWTYITIDEGSQTLNIFNNYYILYNNIEVINQFFHCKPL